LASWDREKGCMVSVLILNGVPHSKFIDWLISPSCDAAACWVLEIVGAEAFRLQSARNFNSGKTRVYKYGNGSVGYIYGISFAAAGQDAYREIIAGRLFRNSFGRYCQTVSLSQTLDLRQSGMPETAVVAIGGIDLVHKLQAGGIDAIDDHLSDPVATVQGNVFLSEIY